jgi:hypothetical protein
MSRLKWKAPLAVASTLAMLCLGGCASHTLSRNVKMISYDDDATRGKTIGPVTGESCHWKVLGYSVTNNASFDAALSDARLKAQGARYLNNVSTETDGFDAYFAAKDCLLVKGVAYK